MMLDLKFTTLGSTIQSAQSELQKDSKRFVESKISEDENEDKKFEEVHC